ncbi:hypothetical protein, partial [Endozoicomonas sp.]|uniref:hypothetical protein n=1 Tax=Endozoicomonas sp. TaxID=1892382 RepID=UPI00383A5A65
GWVLALPRRAWERGGFCDNRLREDDGRGGVALLRHPRRRESISREGVYLEQWIPAFAGMTVGC